MGDNLIINIRNELISEKEGYVGMIDKILDNNI